MSANCVYDLSVCRARDAAVNAAVGIALLLDGCLQDVQHDSRLAEDESPVALCHQLCQQPHNELSLAGCAHSCSILLLFGTGKQRSPEMHQQTSVEMQDVQHDSALAADVSLVTLCHQLS